MYLHKIPKYVETKLYCLRIHTEIVKKLFSFFKEVIAVKVRITSEEREEVVIRKRNVWGGASGVLEVFYCLTLVVLM